jgi:hypothetical protein
MEALGLRPPAGTPEYESHLPAIEQMLVDSDGHLWIREGSVHPFWEAGKWLVTDREGRLVASVITPAGLVVSGIGRDYVLGTCENDDGSSSACSYALDRRAGASGAR